MAIIKQGILGGIQNKIGNVVGTSWKGIAVLKSLPVSIANPRTAPQVEQRSRFTAVVLFATAILAEVIKPLWDRFAQKQSGYNAFIARNIDYFGPQGLISPQDLVISSGKMSATPINNIVFDNALDKVTVIWTEDAGQGFKQGTDTAYIVLRNRNTGEVKGFDTRILRVEERAIIDFKIDTRDDVDCWLAFRRADGTIVSDTSYVTGTV